jgi:beta propeller repeat protein
VWQHNGSTLDFDIYSYDIATGVTKRLTTLAAEQAQNPAIAGDKVVWEDRRNGNFDVYLYDLATSTERRITTNASDQNYPAVSGNTVVWQDWRDGNNQIYLYDVVVGTEQRMTNNVHDQSEPAMSGDRIVYTDGRNGNYDIYMSRIATPGFTLIGPSSVAYDATALMTGTLESADGFVLPGKAVTIQISKDKKTWTSANSTVTAGGGAFSVESPQLRTARYLRVRFAGDSSYPSATSGAVLVRPRLSFSSAPKFKTSTLKYGRTYAVWGYFKPEHSSGSKQIKVKAYRYNGSSWIYKRTYSTKTSNTSASSYTKYKGYVRLPSKGTWRLRAYHATDSKNAKSYSDYRTVTVK